MLSKLLIVIIIALIIYVLRNMSKAHDNQTKVKSKKDEDVIDAEFKVVKDDDKQSK